jgi:hypothetical protein
MHFSLSLSGTASALGTLAATFTNCITLSITINKAETMNTIEDAIQKQRLVDINLFNGKIEYTGICLIATSKIIAIVNYDSDKRTFDGFTIFRNRDFDSFGIWKKKFIEIDIDNSAEFITKYNVSTLRTFYSWLKKIADKELVAFYTYSDLDSYYVGKVIHIDTLIITVKLIDEKGHWLETEKFKLSDIAFFSFQTAYESKLAAKTLQTRSK